MLAFTRQIILLIPVALTLSLVFKMGIYGVLYAGLIADSITFILAIIVFLSEYNNLTKIETEEEIVDVKNKSTYSGKHIVITISREYGSGGRFVGRLLADKLKINFYDKELITLAAKESGLSKSYINKEDEKKTTNYIDNNNDLIYLAEQKVIKKLAKNESCVIVGRCAGNILKDNKDTLKVFIYNSETGKVNRAIKYFNIPEEEAVKTVRKINKERRKYYKYYTGVELDNTNNYDLCFNSDYLSVEEIANAIISVIKREKD